MHLTELLPNKDLAFDVNMSIDDQVDVGPDLIVGSESRGSRETLIEAGASGRMLMISQCVGLIWMYNCDMPQIPMLKMKLKDTNGFQETPANGVSS